MFTDPCIILCHIDQLSKVKGKIDIYVDNTIVKKENGKDLVLTVQLIRRRNYYLLKRNLLRLIFQI